MDYRKNIYSLSLNELNDFREAVNLLKANGTYDTFIERHHHAMMHATPMSGEPNNANIRNAAHRGPAFSPWHRQELREFELALQSVKPGVTLPYWDWAQDAALPDPTAAPLWTDAYIGGDGAGPNNLVPDGPFKDWVARIETSTGALVPRSTPGIVRMLGRDPLGFPTLPNAAEVTDSLTEGVYDSAPWRTTSTPSFRNRLEGWLRRPAEPPEPRMHNRVHTWVGGDMQPGTSPNDPVFFLHHCNIDRIWAQWQAANPGLPYVPASGGPPGHNATDPMLFLEVAGVTPNSTLDHHAMGYMYDTEPPIVTQIRWLEALAWAWIIIIGGLMVTPGGIECIRCGRAVTRVLGVVSMALGVLGLVSQTRAGRAGVTQRFTPQQIDVKGDMHS